MTVEEKIPFTVPMRYLGINLRVCKIYIGKISRLTEDPNVDTGRGKMVFPLGRLNTVKLSVFLQLIYRSEMSPGITPAHC